jgi:hypothetical protein
LKERLAQKHDVRFVADNHARSLRVRELQVEIEAQTPEKFHGSGEVSNR